MATRLKAGSSAGLLLLLLGLLALLPGVAASAPTATDSMALLLRKNVVIISAGMETGMMQKGFGFIAGYQGDELFLVTANHVVRSDIPGDETLEISVRFFGDPGRSHKGELMETYYPSPLDLAVVRVRKPRGLNWEPRAMMPPDKFRSSVRGTKVWFVGRGGDWYVPTLPGRVNSDRPDLNSILFVDINSVMPGTSGAPLISDLGIMGMIVQDEANGVARAVSIEAIRQAFNEWRYPWSLEAAATIEPETVVTITPKHKAKKTESPSDTVITPTPQPKATSRKIKGGIAIFPLLLKQHADQYSLIFRRIITESVTESGYYNRVLECFKNTRHQGNDGEISFDRSLVERIWVKEGWFSEVKPDMAFIRQLGRRLGVETVLLFSASVQMGNDPMQFYLMDVASGKVKETKGYTDWLMNDFQDTIVEASLDTKDIARSALQNYQENTTR